MKNKKVSVFTVLVFFGIIFFISGCAKDEESAPLEPISLVKPEFAVVSLFPGENLPLEIKFTTDRPINWIKGMFDIDSFGLPGHVPVYADTLFFQRLDSLDPRVNLYTYTGSYHVYDSLMPFDVIRFKISFEAGSPTFTSGGTQNYPAGVVSFSKEFRIDVR